MKRLLKGLLIGIAGYALLRYLTNNDILMAIESIAVLEIAIVYLLVENKK